MDAARSKWPFPSYLRKSQLWMQCKPKCIAMDEANAPSRACELEFARELRLPAADPCCCQSCSPASDEAKSRNKTNLTLASGIWRLDDSDCLATVCEVARAARNFKFYQRVRKLEISTAFQTWGLLPTVPCSGQPNLPLVLATTYWSSTESGFYTTAPDIVNSRTAGSLGSSKLHYPRGGHRNFGLFCWEHSFLSFSMAIGLVRIRDGRSLAPQNLKEENSEFSLLRAADSIY